MKRHIEKLQVDHAVNESRSVKKQFSIWKKIVTMVTLVAFCASTTTPAFAKSPVKLQNWGGTIDYSAEGPSSFEISGNASHLGRFTACGEVDLFSGEEEGSIEGDGVVVFEAANGDLIVGVVAMEADADSLGSIHFSWRDSVEFSDGTIVSSTGRFADAENRPPGLVVIAIIALLIGLLLPEIRPI